MSDNDNDCCMFCGCVMPIISSSSVSFFCSCRCIPLPATVVRSRSLSSLSTRSPSVSSLQLLLLFLVCAPFLVFSHTCSAASSLPLYGVIISCQITFRSRLNVAVMNVLFVRKIIHHVCYAMCVVSIAPHIYAPLYMLIHTWMYISS